MNTYVFVLTDGTEIVIPAATRVCAMEEFERLYYENGEWKVELSNIKVKTDVTNGDMMRKIFPDCRVVGNHNTYKIDGGIKEIASYIKVYFDNTCIDMEFDANWWNELYQF